MKGVFAIDWITQLISGITQGMKGVGEAIINFLTSGFTLLFLTTNTEGSVTGVSNFGIFAFVLMGISLVMGLSYFLVNLIRRKI